jgi:CHAD domain-containing protein
MAAPAERYAPFRKRLDDFIESARRIHEGDVEAVHRTRVASRRLREFVPLLGLDHDTSEKLSQQLTKVTRRLGKVRELDVLSLEVDQLSCDGAYSAPALREMSADVAHERASAREHLATKLSPKKLDEIVGRLERVAEQLKLDEPKRYSRTPIRGPRQAWLLALEARVARRATRVRSEIDSAGAAYSPARLHDVRIAVKKLRYACELMAEARRQRATPAIQTLKSAQDLLGRLHDRQVLIERARRLQASSLDLTTGDRLGALAHALEVDCRTLHARYMDDRALLMVTAARMGGAAPGDAFEGGRIAS